MSNEQQLPDWAEELKARYVSGQASMFLVHGNVRDVQPYTDDTGTIQWYDMRGFLEKFLGRTRTIVVYYNQSQGLCFPDRSHEKRFQTAIDARRMMEGEPKLTAIPRTPTSALPVIEELITDPINSSGVIMDFFEMIAPNGDISFMSDQDRANLVTLQRWSSDPVFLSTDNLVILLAEHLSEVSRRVVASPQLATIQVPFPDESLRSLFVSSEDLSTVKMPMDQMAFAKVTAGLSLTQIRSLIRGARQTGDPIDFRTISRRKKRIIEQECHGLVELVAPDHDFSHVGGLARIKRDLLRVSDAVKKGHANQVPMGMIFVGPMGTGKTFVGEAFAAESGLTCLKFKNFREKWVGSTEANLEKILDLVDALGYVLLIIDEADRSLSAGESDGGTSSRVIARLKEFMSDTDHRGRVVILMMTNRPDKLDTDLKRPGRFDVKVPFFFPEEPEERELIFKALVRKNKLILAEGVSWEYAVEASEGYSGAELEAILLNAGGIAAEGNRNVIGQADLDAAAGDVIPSRDTHMLQFMELLAVFECSARRMLPDRYKDMATDEVQSRLSQLRLLLGRRAG
ncbi:MAG: AAA family ATPase [Deltaproteobacteria bacterium]|nr:AAA family ATPase [Deltaproteobacteria bacterium]